ncbi:MAG: hypothetical protein ACYS83_06650 [Planctomycetota bacterium]|jgi:hypothetical protein
MIASMQLESKKIPENVRQATAKTTRRKNQPVAGKQNIAHSQAPERVKWVIKAAV